MKILLAPTEDFIKRERTFLAVAASAGSNVVITVQNVANFSVNDYIVLGTEGSEQAELTQITAISGETLTVALLKLNHFINEPIVKYRYNTRKFYGSTTSGGSYTELTSYGSPVAIQVDDPQNTLLEYTGIEGYQYFKSTYFNQTTNEETSQGDAVETLANESARYCSLYAIRRQAGMIDNPYMTDGIIEMYRKRAENEVDSYLNARYILPLVNSLGIAEVPFLVENCTMLLAAGYMDYREYGKDGEGVKWIGEARGILKRLQTPGGQQLLGNNKAEMQTQILSNGVQGYPDQVDNNCGPIRMFTSRQRF